NTMVSVAPDGSYCTLPPPPLTALGTTAAPAVSDDGRFVAFLSNCTNFAPGDTNGKVDAFVRDTCLSNGTLVSGCTATRERVSGLAGQPDASGLVDSGMIDMSADGRYVVFSANIGFSARQQVLLRDRLLGTTTVVSLNDQGQQNGANFAHYPRMSA